MLFNGLWLIACLGSMCTSRYQLPHQLNFLKRFQGFWSYVITRWWFHFCSPCSPLFSRWWCIFTDKGVYLLIRWWQLKYWTAFSPKNLWGRCPNFLSTCTSDGIPTGYLGDVTLSCTEGVLTVGGTQRMIGWERAASMLLRVGCCHFCHIEPRIPRKKT